VLAGPDKVGVGSGQDLDWRGMLAVSANLAVIVTISGYQVSRDLQVPGVRLRA
jgi:hypothetical protein